MSHPHSPSHDEVRIQTIRQIIQIKFPRIHSSDDVLVSTTSRSIGPALSPTPIGPGSKRSWQQASTVENDKSEHPFYRELVAWQDPMPGYFLMHLPAQLRLNGVKSFDNLPFLLFEKIHAFPSGLDLPIPPTSRYASETQLGRLFNWEDLHDPSKAVETTLDLRKAHLYQGQLIAACASAVAANPEYFTDSVDFLTSTDTSRTIHPGSGEVCAAEYLTLNPDLPGIRASTKRKLQAHYEAIEHFGLSSLQATHIQPICAPLNADFPLSAVVQFAQEQLPLESFICQGRDDDAVHSCRSDHCTGRVLDFPVPFTNIWTTNWHRQ